MRVLLAAICLFVFTLSQAQSTVGIGTTTPAASAALDVSSTTRGLLPPRMTAAQRNAIATPANGLIVFDTDSAALMVRSAGGWRKLSSTASGDLWIASGSNISSNYIGNVGIGTANPTHKLSIEHNATIGLLVKSLSSFSAVDIDANSGDAALRFYSGGQFRWLTRNRPFDNSFEIFEGGGGSRVIVKASTGYVGIADNDPVANLSIGGNIKIADGTQGVGKVLTSDAGGVASWQTLPPAPSQFWTVNGNNITNSNSGNVGIGVSFPPQSKLVVAGNAAIGSRVSSTGESALATGFFTFASGNNSVAGGSYSAASGENALAFGNSSEASALNAAAFGLAIIVNAPHSFGVGSYNSIEDTNTPFPNQRIFQVGNGVATNVRRNALTVLRNANVGIGVDAPEAPLHFVNDTRNRKIILWSSVNNDHQFYGFGVNAFVQRYQVPATTDGHVFYAGTSASTSNELFRVQGNGHIGIAQSNPQVPLHFATALGKKISLYRGPLGDAGFGVWGNELRIHSDYNGADITFGFDDFTNGFTERFRVRANGNATLAGVLTQNSDARLKKNIEPINNASDLLQHLHGYRYQWKDENADAEKQLGLLAQEVQKVLPELVKEGENGKLGVNYSGLIPVLLEALKEQQQKALGYEKKVQLLLEKVAEQERRLAELEKRLVNQ